MGLRFKKSVKIAPGVKVNLNKKSTSVTLGTKGVHHTVNSNGKKTTSVGVPGTGLSYVSTNSDKKGKSRNSHSKADSYTKKESSDTTLKKITGCFTYLLLGILCILLVFVGLVFIVDPSPELTGIEAEWTANEYSINDSAEIKISPIPDSADIESLSLSDNSIATLEYKDGKAIITFNAEGSEELYFIADEEINSNAQLITVINANEAERIAAEQAAQAEAERIAAEQAEAERIAAEQAAQQQNQEQMVWISATGSKYHSKPDCGKMNPNNASQMSLSQAEAQGYGPCSKCF